MLQLKRNLLSASLASAIALTASGVQAQTAQGPSGQETATTELDKVVVVGIRSRRIRTQTIIAALYFVLYVLAVFEYTPVLGVDRADRGARVEASVAP